MLKFGQCWMTSYRFLFQLNGWNENISNWDFWNFLSDGSKAIHMWWIDDWWCAAKEANNMAKGTCYFILNQIKSPNSFLMTQNIYAIIIECHVYVSLDMIPSCPHWPRQIIYVFSPSNSRKSFNPFFRLYSRCRSRNMDTVDGNIFWIKFCKKKIQ